MNSKTDVLLYTKGKKVFINIRQGTVLPSKQIQAHQSALLCLSAESSLFQTSELQVYFCYQWWYVFYWNKWICPIYCLQTTHMNFCWSAVSLVFMHHLYHIIVIKTCKHTCSVKLESKLSPWSEASSYQKIMELETGLFLNTLWPDTTITMLKKNKNLCCRRQTVLGCRMKCDVIWQNAKLKERRVVCHYKERHPHSA